MITVGIGNLNLYAKSLLGDGVLKPLRYEDTKILLPNNFRAVDVGTVQAMVLVGNLICHRFRFSQLEEALVAEGTLNGCNGPTILVSNLVKGRVIYQLQNLRLPRDHDFASKNCHFWPFDMSHWLKTNDGRNYRHLQVELGNSGQYRSAIIIFSSFVKQGRISYGRAMGVQKPIQGRLFGPP